MAPLASISPPVPAPRQLPAHLQATPARPTPARMPPRSEHHPPPARTAPLTPAGRSGVLQRLTLVPTAELLSDVGRYVEIYYWSLSHRQEKIVALEQADLSKMADDEILYLMGHGSATTYNGMDADTLAEKLLANGLREEIGGIVLLSCKAGLGGGNSLVTQLHTALKGKWPVSGYKGATAVDTRGEIHGIDPVKNTVLLDKAFDTAWNSEEAQAERAHAAELIQENYALGKPKLLAVAVALATKKSFAKLHAINKQVFFDPGQGVQELQRKGSLVAY